MTKTYSVSFPDEMGEELEEVRKRTGASISWQLRQFYDTQKEVDNETNTDTTSSIN